VSEGYKRQRYKLTWSDGPYEGLVILARPPTVDALLDLEELQTAAGTGDRKALRELIGHLAGLIVSWNVLDDDGQPVPVSGDALAEDLGMIYAISDAYASKVMESARVPPPLPRRSGSTRAKPAAPQIPPEIPMTPLKPVSRAS
jgi:hypothetical protein